MASAVNKIVNGQHDATEISAINSSKEDEMKMKSENSELQEVTKRSIRVQTWRKMQDKKLISIHNVFNRIPTFIGIENAVELLAETPEFKAANNIKVDVDRSQDAIKLKVLACSKNLYLSPGKESKALYAKINCAATEDAATQKNAILVANLNEYGTEINFLEKNPLDIVFYGSVAVSKAGERIGRGNGYVDLDFATLKHCGSITDKTIIATVIHDEQLYDTLPSDLFSDLDVPIDLIITPTQVIRITKKLPRPAGIKWPLLSERRMRIVPVLQSIREYETQNGKVIDIKDEDTDVETNRRPKVMRRFVRRNRKGRSTGENGKDESSSRRWRRKSKKSSDDNKQSTIEKSKSKNQNEDDDDDDDENEPVIPTKRSLRLDTWKKMERKRCAPFPLSIYNRVPNFVGSDLAASLLAETEEYKSAKNIKVNSDKAQDSVKLKAICDSKNLYVATARDSTALYAKINCPSDADGETKKRAIRNQNIGEYGTEIDLANKVVLDMLVLGAVVVSKTGYRIGRGNGYVDLDFGILVKAGAINDKTIIVATVHDEQVCDTLPTELFTEYDVPVDMIVTPTEVIRVQNKLQRPTGIFWKYVSERRLGIVPILKTFHANDEKEGKEVILKEYNTDVDEQRKPQIRRRFFNRRNDRSESKGENDENRQRRRRRFGRKPKKSKTVTTDGEGEQSEGERKKRQKKRRENRDYCIKVSNIPKVMRISEFKSELRKKGCNPMFISWKGSYGTCYLHFNKQEYEENSDEAVASILNNLKKLNLTDPNETNDNALGELKIEVVKRQPQNRIETVNVSAV